MLLKEVQPQHSCYPHKTKHNPAGLAAYQGHNAHGHSLVQFTLFHCSGHNQTSNEQKIGVLVFGGLHRNLFK